MDDVFDRLMQSAGVADGDRARVLKLLQSLRGHHPRDTPARHVRTRTPRGCSYPTAHCQHGVARGECVVCDPKIGTRFYFTGGGTHVHSTPTCRALADGQEKVRRRGGNPDVIDVVPRYSGFLDARDPCRHCLPTRGSIAPKVGPTSPRKHAETRAELRQLTPKDTPAIGQRVDWGGYSGPVVEVASDGLRIATGGFRMFIAWGEYVRVQPTSGS